MKYYGFWRSLAACRVRIALAMKGVAAALVFLKEYLDAGVRSRTPHVAE